MDGNSTTVDASALVGPLVPRRPVFHPTVTGENCTALRLETVTLPVALISGIDLGRVALIGLMPAPGMLRHLFFDSIQLVRK